MSHAVFLPLEAGWEIVLSSGSECTTSARWAKTRLGKHGAQSTDHLHLCVPTAVTETMDILPRIHCRDKSKESGWKGNWLLTLLCSTCSLGQQLQQAMFFEKKNSYNFFFFLNIISGVTFLFQSSTLHPHKLANKNKLIISGKHKLNHNKSCMHSWPGNPAFNFICLSTFALVISFEGFFNAAL